MTGAPLTIAHVDTETGWSGGQVQVSLLMDGLAARGHANVLVSPPGSRLGDWAEGRGMTRVPVSMRNDLHLSAVRRIKRCLVEQDVDIVHLHSGRANWLGGLAARWAGRPALTTRRMDHPVKRHLVNRIVYGKLVSRAVGIAPAVSRRLLDGGVPPARVVTIWSTVDPGARQPTTPRELTRRAMDVDPEQQVLLAAAHLTRRKGLDVALRALARLPGLPAVLWIAGDGPEIVALEFLAKQLSLGSRVRFLGARDDLPDLSAAADIFVMPSRSEGLGIAALEAMAAGLPVVASRVGGLAEAVVHEGTGLLVPAEDAEALSQALSLLCNDSDLRRRLAAAGPRRIREQFLPARMANDYEALYREILAERGVGTGDGRVGATATAQPDDLRDGSGARPAC
jgi:glycosyltransferase involved in cell wall biosynthesis